jgi:hypothetical protein
MRRLVFSAVMGFGIAVSLIALAQSKAKLEPFVPAPLPQTIKPNPVPKSMTENQKLPPGASFVRNCLPSIKGLLVPVDVSNVKPDPVVSKQILTIVNADQAARVGIMSANVNLEDQKRREKLLPLIPKAVTAEDFSHISLVFQHSDCVPLFMLANRMASMAIELIPAGTTFESKYGNPRWLYAATLDRALMNSDLAQKFGTQYLTPNGSCTKLYVVDPRTTDAERAKYGVPSLKQAIAQAKTFDHPGCK